MSCDPITSSMASIKSHATGRRKHDTARSFMALERLGSTAHQGPFANPLLAGNAA